MMNYVAATTRPNVSHAAHQCARFSSNPKWSQEVPIKRAGRNVKRTKDKGSMCDFDTTKGIEVLVGSKFARTCNTSDSNKMPSALSKTCRAMKMANYPVS